MQHSHTERYFFTFTSKIYAFPKLLQFTAVPVKEDNTLCNSPVMSHQFLILPAQASFIKHGWSETHKIVSVILELLGYKEILPLAGLNFLQFLIT